MPGVFRARLQAATRQVDPCLSLTLPFDEIGEAHQLMYENKGPAGDISVLVNAPRQGISDLDLAL